ncbi:DUF6660 family protein [Paraflavitalea soli]|uniref:DUF6660 family protein n=1 Tax=Paraflavitalea soli TaxID=2315862 RepID=UPI0013C3F11E|nr:DUF6660 family protein [Paraflavitalea soli]
MKLFAFIMAILIMIMSCTPCADGAGTMQSSKSETKLAAVAESHDHGGTADDCSPLCTCACCSAHSCPQSFITANTAHADNSLLTHGHYYNGTLISISLPIWQPPQLVA